MLGLLLVAVLVGWAVMKRQTVDEPVADLTQKVSTKLGKLWDIAQDSLKERKYLRAEKALLTILKVDQKNASAYNRLGILYAKQQAFVDAIECFEIAQSLEPSASSLHNVGLIYYETRQYDKASLAFEQALEVEDTLASRHIAYAKVLEKLGNFDKMIQSLETAIKIEPSIQSFQILADAYERMGDSDKATRLRQKISRALDSANSPKKQVQQVRKVQI